MSVHIRKLRALLATYEDGEVYTDDDGSMLRVIELVTGAGEYGYFLHLKAHVRLFIQTIDDTFTPVIAVGITPQTELLWSDVDMDQVIDTETSGAEQAEATLKNILHIATTVIEEFRGRWIRREG